MKKSPRKPFPSNRAAPKAGGKFFGKRTAPAIFGDKPTAPAGKKWAGPRGERAAEPAKDRFTDSRRGPKRPFDNRAEGKGKSFALRKGGRGRSKEVPLETYAAEHKEIIARREQKKFQGEKKPYAQNAFHNRNTKRFDDKQAAATPRFIKDKAAVKRKEKRQDKTPALPREGILLWGTHAVKAAWLNPQRHCFKLWLTEAGRATMKDVITEGKELGLKRPDVINAERSDIERLLPPHSVHQGAVLEVAPLEEKALHQILQGDTPPDLIIVLDQVTDPHNVGAILRSAAAFGAGALVMTERNAPTTTGVMAKTASGAAEHVPQVHVVNLSRALTELQEAGYWCIGLAEQGNRELSGLDLSARTAIVLGAEGDGLRRLTRESCDELARLPTSGAIGSLNVSNAAAVAMYEARRQKMKFG